MSVDVSGVLSNGITAEHVVLLGQPRLNVYMGEIEQNSTRIDTMYFSINYTNSSTPYNVDINLKEYADITMYEFIDLTPSTGLTDDVVCFIFDWSEYIFPSSGLEGYNRWYKVDVPQAINNDFVIDFKFELAAESNNAAPVDNHDVVFDISNAPNPFNPVTAINFSLAKSEVVNIGIYNILGRNIKMLVNEQLQAGNHSVIWNGDNESGSKVASGIYFYRIVAGEFNKTKKMVLMK